MTTTTILGITKLVEGQASAAATVNAALDSLDAAAGISVTTGITASTTQTQGQGALTSVLNVVATCANANDVVTLPAAAAGKRCVVVNNGAQACQVFPASGDAIDVGAVDASTTVAAAGRKTWWAADATTWHTVSAS